MFRAKYCTKRVELILQINKLLLHLVGLSELLYLDIHLDRTLTWREHIPTKRKQLDLKLRKLYWIIGRKSQLSLDNKLLVYKAILKPIWT